VDPYAILGVQRSADAATVRHAYRRRAKKLHPDAGGDPGAFDDLRRAQKLLLDAERRQIYDQTGQIADERVDNSDANVVALLVTAFDEAIRQRGGDVTRITRTDLPAAMDQWLRHRQDEVGKARRHLTQNMGLITVLIGRMERLDGTASLFDAVLQGRHAEAARHLRQADEQLAQIKAARELLQLYRYRQDVDLMTWSATATTTTGTGTW
jgi:curved DNA-binding protein CbpA